VREELIEDALDEGLPLPPDVELAAADAATVGAAAIPDGALRELRDAMSLVWRVLLVWLSVLALFVLAGYVG
jgi:AmpE protein